MEIEMDSENKSQLKRLRKPSLLLSQEESLAKNVKKYPRLFDKSQKSAKRRCLKKRMGSRSIGITLYWRWNAIYYTVYIISSLFRKNNYPVLFWKNAILNFFRIFSGKHLQRLRGVNINRFLDEIQILHVSLQSLIYEIFVIIVLSAVETNLKSTTKRGERQKYISLIFIFMTLLRLTRFKSSMNFQTCLESIFCLSVKYVIIRSS